MFGVAVGDVETDEGHGHGAENGAQFVEVSIAGASTDCHVREDVQVAIGPLHPLLYCVVLVDA